MSCPNCDCDRCFLRRNPELGYMQIFVTIDSDMTPKTRLWNNLFHYAKILDVAASEHLRKTKEIKTEEPKWTPKPEPKMDLAEALDRYMNVPMAGKTEFHDVAKQIWNTEMVHWLGPRKFFVEYWEMVPMRSSYGLDSEEERFNYELKIWCIADRETVVLIGKDLNSIEMISTMGGVTILEHQPAESWFMAEPTLWQWEEDEGWHQTNY